MIAALLLPSLAPPAANRSQVLIALRERTLPADGGVSSGRDESHRLTIFDGSITLLEVVCPISAHGFDLCVSPPEQTRRSIAIQKVFVGDERGTQLMSRSIHRNVQLAPRPPLIRPMHPHFPFAFAIDFETR